MLKLDKLAVRLGPGTYEFSMQASASSVSAIVGKSGSGKSTLLNLVAGFLKPDSGSLHWQESDLLTLPPEQRPVTTLFQQHNLFAHLTVNQNIGLGLHPGLKLSSEQHTQVANALDEVGMHDQGHKRPNALSGGEQQRVALARCLLRNQPILLLDEPFSALDADTRETMLELTQRIIEQRQLCTLLVTHQHDDAAFFNAEVYKIKAGLLHRA